MLRQYLPDYDATDKGEPQGKKLHLQTASLLPVALQNARNGHASFHSSLPHANKQTSTLVYTLVEAILQHV
jgi:hypothetical protein